MKTYQIFAILFIFVAAWFAALYPELALVGDTCIVRDEKGEEVEGLTGDEKAELLLRSEKPPVVKSRLAEWLKSLRQTDTEGENDGDETCKNLYGRNPFLRRDERELSGELCWYAGSDKRNIRDYIS